MYKLPYFQEPDFENVKSFLQQHPFITLMGVNKDQQPVATQLPVLLDWQGDQLRLSGHMMRSTDHHNAFVNNPQILALFTGAHCYVSASWYSNPRQGSTWNYMSVQARGAIRFLDETALRSILQRTTAFFENNPDSGAQFSDLSDAYINRLLPAIVGFEIEVRDLENVFKLSQNRDEESYRNIIQQLKTRDAAAQQIAAEMESRQAWKK